MEVIKEIGEISALDLAHYILKKCRRMPQFKLHKIVFYCEAYHLAYFQRMLITEPFEAWARGPACRELYESLKAHKRSKTGDLMYDSKSGNLYVNKITETLTSKQIEIIDEVIEALCDWSEGQIESTARSEPPWKEARGDTPEYARCENVISKVTTMDYYRNELYSHPHNS